MTRVTALPKRKTFTWRRPLTVSYANSKTRSGKCSICPAQKINRRSRFQTRELYFRETLRSVYWCNSPVKRLVVVTLESIKARVEQGKRKTDHGEANKRQISAKTRLSAASGKPTNPNGVRRKGVLCSLTHLSHSNPCSLFMHCHHA